MSTPPSACDKQNSDKSDSFEKQVNKNKEIDLRGDKMLLGKKTKKT